jgi:3-dehydroquinate dehydratase type I
MERPYGLPRPIEIILELRLDWIRDPDPEKLLRRRPGKLLVTNRRREEGGLFSGTEEERVTILGRAAASGADYVDIEASTGPRLVAGLKKEIANTPGKSPKLVVSWHDFQKTPSERLLREKLAGCGEWSPDIVKIVTMARTVEDNLKILRLIPYARRKGMEVIAFCMGPAGRISRVASVLLGGYLGFAAADGHERSAPGQMPVREMARILRMLGSSPLAGPTLRLPAHGRRSVQAKRSHAGARER